MPWCRPTSFSTLLSWVTLEMVGEVQAARHAASVWGIQWHPEVDDAIVAAWANDGSLPEAEKERVLDDLVRSRQALDVAWQPLAVRFSALVIAAAGTSAG